MPGRKHRGVIGWTTAALVGSMVVISAASLQAQPAHRHGTVTPAGPPPAPFVPSTSRSFGQLMDDAMAVMDFGMRSAPMNGEVDHDFINMMIPHHQGAVDMARALLLYTKDPELRNLAQGIIVEQQNEIRLMQAWLQRHRPTPAAPSPTTKEVVP